MESQATFSKMGQIPRPHRDITRMIRDSNLYLSAYSPAFKKEVLNGRTAFRVFDEVTLFLLRGLPGSGKSYHVENVLIPQLHQQERNIVIINANTTAAERESKLTGTPLTPENRDQLTQNHYKNRKPTNVRERQRFMRSIHEESLKTLSNTLQQIKEGEAPPKTAFVIDNTNIRLFEAASPVITALSYGLKKENMHLITVFPMNNPLLKEKLPEDHVRDAMYENWPKKEIRLVRDVLTGNKTQILRRLVLTEETTDRIICSKLADICKTMNPLDRAENKDYMLARLQQYREQPNMNIEDVIVEAISINDERRQWRY